MAFRFDEIAEQYQYLPFKNSFMFRQVMQNTNIAKQFLEAVLGKEIDKVDPSLAVKNRFNACLEDGARLEVYPRGKSYPDDVFIVSSEISCLEQKTRVYLAAMNSYPNTCYVIHVCNFDPFMRGLARYETVSCLKGFDDTPYDDGTRVIFLNSRYENGNADPQILAFLDYLREGDSITPNFGLAKAVHDEVMKCRKDEASKDRFVVEQLLRLEKDKAV